MLYIEEILTLNTDERDIWKKSDELGKTANETSWRWMPSRQHPNVESDVQVKASIGRVKSAPWLITILILLVLSIYIGKWRQIVLRINWQILFKSNARESINDGQWVCIDGLRSPLWNSQPSHICWAWPKLSPRPRQLAKTIADRKTAPIQSDRLVMPSRQVAPHFYPARPPNGTYSTGCTPLLPNWSTRLPSTNRPHFNWQLVNRPI